MEQILLPRDTGSQLGAGQKVDRSPGQSENAFATGSYCADRWPAFGETTGSVPPWSPRAAGADESYCRVLSESC